MPFSQKYCLVQMIDRMDIGDEFSSSEWPLHCTIAGVFALDWTDELMAEFGAFIAKHQPFAALTTEIAFFGPEKTVKVRRLEITPELYSLHESVANFIEQHHGSFNDPQYVRQGFGPHITMRGELPAEHEIISFQQQVLIDMFPNGDHTQRRIIALLPLKKI